ncbi:PAS domain-containing protein [Massilia litorea]|uniref:histidine kinase n=1 Tax=Massilia litorea TaxID=2769491 RepID=A0A7L9U6I9_9BURK|nr:PAS domain-containing protein [Massilia litorea]QOL50661.1 PAS domain-containing protein [Massilia litorea]
MQHTSPSAPLLDTNALGLQLFESSPDCLKLLSNDGHIVAMNRNGICAMEIDDFKRFAGALWKSFWPQESQAAVDAALALARAGGIGQFKAYCPTAAGTPRWWEVMVTAVRAEDGQLQHLLAVSRDVTAAHETGVERERLLKEVQATNARMADIFNQTPAFMAVFSGPDHVIELINERYQQLVGKRDPVGQPIRQALPEVEGQGFFELLDEVYRTGEPFTGTDMPVMLQRQPGAALEERFIDLVFTALRDPDGAITGLLVHGVDQTERTLAAEKLRASEERYRTLFESMDQGFAILEMIFDAGNKPVDYRFLEMNGMFERHTGLAEATGKTARELVPELDRFWFDTYGRVALTGEAVRFESEAAALGRWFDVYATPIGGAGSGRVALLFSDITARKRSDEQLRHLAADLSEADRRKTEFLATLAHELRNPLAPIRSGLGLMRLSGDNAGAVRRVREMMERQVGHMVHLIDDLLDVARISGGKLELKRERAGLARILSSAVETSMPLIEAARHRLNVALPDQELVVDADVTRIAQVVANLLNNAAKYTPAGGRIDLSLRDDGEFAVVTVSDTGVGIPADSLISVFDMFKQVERHVERAQGGLGIGLSLVRRLVEMHGGSVTAASAGAGKGSTFEVRLPLAASGATQAPAAQAGDAGAAAGPCPGLRVLVVDDNVDAALTLSMILEASGHTTRVAHDGVAALQAAVEFMPQVAFLDIGMPGLNGYETASAMRIKPGLESITLVALTGWGTDSDRLRSSDAGFDHHLTKPAQLGAVQDLLARLAHA